MKIYFDNVNFASQSGPNTFANRLSRQLANMGHDPFVTHENYDVALVFIEPTQKLNTNKPFVHRCDGIWSKPNEFKHKNIAIKWAYDNAHANIIQSQFDKKFIEKHWGTKNNSYVVGNGIDLNDIKDAMNINCSDSCNLQSLQNNYSKIFVCSSNWHPQKRLNANYDLFKHIRTNLFPSSCLIVMGQNATQPLDKSIKPHVFFTGPLSHKHCLQIFLQSDYMFHCAYGDHAPNVIYESVACGTSVVCSNIGGTGEILTTQTGIFGKILQEKEEFNFDLFDYDDPPNIDVTQCDSLQIPTIEQQNKINDKIDIKNVAQKYVSILQSVL